VTALLRRFLTLWGEKRYLTLFITSRKRGGRTQVFMKVFTQNGRQLCRTCGRDITEHARYKRWTQCYLCYVKDQFERHDKRWPLEVVKKELREVRARLTELPKEIAEADSEYRRAFKQTTWLTRLLDPNPRLVELRKRSEALALQKYKCESRVSELEGAIARSKALRKKIVDAQLGRAKAEQRRVEEVAAQIQFMENCGSMLNQDFSRILYLIQSKDYRRGNAVDNYVRKILTAGILQAFDQRCAFCGDNSDLTFDHYGLTKNEGGNFILIVKQDRAFKVNLVVLCRGCNSMKGQLSYLAFFDDNKRKEITKYQGRVLELILADPVLIKLLKRWSK
jgi:hypothetical protein